MEILFEVEVKTSSFFIECYKEKQLFLRIGKIYITARKST